MLPGSAALRRLSLHIFSKDPSPGLRIGPTPGLGPCPQNPTSPHIVTAAARISSTPKQATTAKIHCGWPHPIITRAPMCGVLQDWQRMVGTKIGKVQGIECPYAGLQRAAAPCETTTACPVMLTNTTQPAKKRQQHHTEHKGCRNSCLVWPRRLFDFLQRLSSTLD